MEGRGEGKRDYTSITTVSPPESVPDCGLCGRKATFEEVTTGMTSALRWACSDESHFNVS